MSPLVLALALQTAAPPPADAVAEEIVVIGEKMKAWRATIRFGKKGTECTVKVSTGDAAIDRIGCAAMEQCWPDVAARFEATRAKGVTAAARKTQRAALNTELGTFVMARREAAIAELADARVAEKLK
ncbi:MULTISPECIES: hypothetical protein [unclassified Sphingomonas]|uniref:hypothetical protein n=1 Tax=unclassified Sphingomonas TaxID=196159 RepID=UPI00083218DE|nr:MULTISPECIES: hypothetical protein [unclassified Sphingomonas]